jgi:hypothetical protein
MEIALVSIVVTLGGLACWQRIYIMRLRRDNKALVAKCVEIIAERAMEQIAEMSAITPEWRGADTASETDVRPIGPIPRRPNDKKPAEE